MLYRDLIQFDPIESVIQLREADEIESAKHLVKTFVISDPMANKLVDVVFRQVQIRQPLDNKGVLVVGNYGTGKSHLMSVISALAEYPETLPLAAHPGVRAAAETIAGQFHVLRVEIGSVRRSLRDILMDELAAALARWGVPVTFPPDDQINNNKDLIIQAVDQFQQHYPGQGILMVVDELLDYLSSRPQRALILDLGFLRELGEVAKLTAFRFIGGLQETLFGNPRFSFAAQQLNRVRDRFEQVNIARQDIAYVVSHRLLRKNDEQKAWIADYLRRFAPLYGQLAERMDEFVELFPIHPAYIETFEALTIAEKREVLKTLSAASQEILDQEVPEDHPGLVSYDHYWKVIQEKPSLRSIEAIAQVIEKSAVLEGLIRNSFTRPDLQPMALRIIHALSVHRLTTSDVHLPLGVTAEGLRDSLCLYRELPSARRDAGFLLDQVTMALREIIRTVQGQFITHNPENGQYYLDLLRVVDFDEKIRRRAETIDREDLNDYLFDALRQALNLSDTTYLTGHSLWFYELPWTDHRVMRQGYLFFGPPDERTTAQPPRDFYIYVIPPFMEREWTDEELADEVIFSLVGLGADFEQQVRLYAGARAMALESTEHRQEYADKVAFHLKGLNAWLREHLTDHLHVTYQGVDEPVKAVLPRAASTASQTIEDLLRLVASSLLAPEFAEKYPHYPRFSRASQPVSDEARANSAMEAIRSIAGRGRTHLATAVLEGLELLDNQGNLRPYNSRYASRLLQILSDKDENQVVNRGEVIEVVAGGIEKPIEQDLWFKLEPEWVVVLLLALVYNGDIVLSLDGREEIDAGSIERVLTCSMETLADFRFYKRPRTLPLALWTLIFEGLDLQAGLIRDENTRESGVIELQRVVEAELQRIVRLQERLQNGAQLWNRPVFTDRLTFVVEAGTVIGSDAPTVTLSATELLPGVRGYKQFLEELRRFNTVGKLRNLRKTPGDIEVALDYRRTVQRAGQLMEMVDQLQPLTTYLATAQANLPVEHPWSQRAAQIEESTLERVRRAGKPGETGIQAQSELAALTRELNALKADYIAAYAELHRRTVLSPQADDRRTRLYNDRRRDSLEELARIDLLTRTGELETWKQMITSLPACREFHERLLESAPTCRCGLRPAQRQVGMFAADVMLENLDRRLSEILRNWRQALRANLSSETARGSLEAMAHSERQPIEAFLAQSDEEETLPPGFVPAAIQALRGIRAVTLTVDELVSALKAGGLPCTREELLNRFRQYVESQMRGHDARNTRLTLDQ